MGTTDTGLKHPSCSTLHLNQGQAEQNQSKTREPKCTRFQPKAALRQRSTEKTPLRPTVKEQETPGCSAGNYEPGKLQGWDASWES